MPTSPLGPSPYTRLFTHDISAIAVYTNTNPMGTPTPSGTLVYNFLGLYKTCRVKSTVQTKDNRATWEGGAYPVPIAYKEVITISGCVDPEANAYGTLMEMFIALGAGPYVLYVAMDRNARLKPIECRALLTDVEHNANGEAQDQVGIFEVQGLMVNL